MKKFLFPFIVLVFSGLLFSACEKLFGDKPVSENNVYLKERDEIRKDISTIEIDFYIDQLVSQYPEILPIKNKTEYGVSLYTIKYETEFSGKKITASGVVAIPVGSGPFPFLSFQNGTYTLHSEAPSVNTAGDLMVFMEIIASTGYVVALPDYLGFGVSDTMFHPYLDKESTIQSVEDMLLATKELVNSENLDINTSNDLYIAGYSMGGWATLHLKKAIESGDFDDFNLKASACGAGPYNLLFVNNYILGLETYPMPYFLGYMMNSYSKLGYISNSISEIFNEPYSTRIPGLFNGMNNGAAINSQLTTNVSELFTQTYRNGFYTNPVFKSAKEAFLNNSIDAWVISTPLLLMHGDKDSFVPYQVTRNMYDDMKALGIGDDKIQLVSFPGSDHQDGIIPFGIASIQWFLNKK